MFVASRPIRLPLAVVLTGILVLAAGVQGAEPVTKYIPDSAMGYVLINNLEKSLTGAETFLKEIGLHEKLIPQSGEKDAPPVTLLSMIRGGLNLGKGFNPAGGFAAILLDPADLGLDTMEVFGLNAPPAASTEVTAEGKEPATAPAPKVRPEPPLVLLVAGSGVAQVFEAYEPVADGAVWKIKMPHSEKPGYAAPVGGYVALSPNKEAVLMVVKAAAGKAPAANDPNAQAVINRGDLVLHINMAKVSPLLLKAMPKFQQEMAGAGSDKEMAAMMLGGYEDILKQLKTLTCSVRLTGDGVALEGYAVALPGTAMAKNFSSQAGVRGGAQTLACLPSLPYVMAIGAAKAVNPDAKAASLESLDSLLKLKALEKVPADLKARTRKLVADYTGEFTGVQMVIGGAPAANGVFGAALVLKCNDSEKVRTMMAEVSALIDGYVKSLIEDESFQKLKIVYTRGAETVNGVAVDVIEFSHPEITDMKEDEKAKLKKAMGEEKIVIRVATAGKDTAVITMGGGQAMIAEALKAAAGKGPIPLAPGTASALKHLPPNASTVMLINAANALDVVRTGMTAFGATEEDLAKVPKLKCQTPIAIGSQAMADGGIGVVYIPTDLVKEVVPVIQGLMSGEDGAAKPPVGAPREREVPREAVPVE